MGVWPEDQRAHGYTPATQCRGFRVGSSPTMEEQLEQIQGNCSLLPRSAVYKSSNGWRRWFGAPHPHDLPHQDKATRKVLQTRREVWAEGGGALSGRVQPLFKLMDGSSERGSM